MNKCLLIFECLCNTTKPVDLETENTTALTKFQNIYIDSPHIHVHVQIILNIYIQGPHNKLLWAIEVWISCKSRVLIDGCQMKWFSDCKVI